MQRPKSEWTTIWNGSDVGWSSYGYCQPGHAICGYKAEKNVLGKIPIDLLF